MSENNGKKNEIMRTRNLEGPLNQEMREYIGLPPDSEDNDKPDYLVRLATEPFSRSLPELNILFFGNGGNRSAMVFIMIGTNSLQYDVKCL